MQVQALVESLAADPQGESTRRLLRVISIVSLALIGLAGSAVTIWLVARAAIDGWQTGDWSLLDLGSLVPLPFLVLLFLAALMAASPQPHPRRVRPLLDAIAGGDGSLAPPAAIQPEVPDADILIVPALRFERLRALEGGSIRGRAALGLILVPLQFGPVFADALSQLLGGDTGIQVFGISLGMLIAVCAVAGGTIYLAAIIIMLLRNRRYLLVTADDFSVSWRRRGILHRTHAAHWTAARSFVCLTYAPSTSSGTARTAYLLDFGDAVLAWEEVPGGRNEELDQVELVTGLVTSRTRLPLRDLTGLPIALSTERSYPESLQLFGLSPDVLAGLKTVGRWSRRMLWLLLPATLLLILGIAVPYVGVQRLEDYQRGYFASLPQKIHAETPLYHDSLAASDNQWDVEQPSKDNGEWNIGFRDGTYQLTGQSGYIVDSSPDRVFRDAAVEVTAVQRGKVADGNDGVGLLLRADTDNNMVVFVVSPTDGSWWLSHDYYYNPAHPNDSWYEMDSGTSAFVHTAAGATNTLLVLARGPTYLLYVNNHFLAAYTDRYHEDPHPVFSGNGNAGVYVNDGATTGIFSNFSVYPVQSPPSLSYV